MDEKELKNGQLAREMFLCLSGRIKNVTSEEKKLLELFLQKNKVEKVLDLGSGRLVIDPVLFCRLKKAVEKYGDIAIDIVNDIIFGFPEDGINIDEVPKQTLLDFFEKE